MSIALTDPRLLGLWSEALEACAASPIVPSEDLGLLGQRALISFRRLTKEGARCQAIDQPSVGASGCGSSSSAVATGDPRPNEPFPGSM